jgi:hypothetical protein
VFQASRIPKFFITCYEAGGVSIEYLKGDDVHFIVNNLYCVFFAAGGMHYVQNTDQLNSDITVTADSVVAELNRKAQQQKLRPQYSPQGAHTCEYQSFKCQHGFVKIFTICRLLLVHTVGEISNKNIVKQGDNDSLKSFHVQKFCCWYSTQTGFALFLGIKVLVLVRYVCVCVCVGGGGITLLVFHKK